MLGVEVLRLGVVVDLTDVQPVLLKIILGDFDLCREERLDQVIHAMQKGTFPAAIKYAMGLRGHPAGHVRAPLQDLTEEERHAVEVHLQHAGILKELYT